MKRTTGIVAGVLAAAAIAALVGLVVVLAMPGGGLAARISNLGADVRDYVAKQVLAIVNTHLEPTLGFASIDYDAPGTVRLTNATLTARDGTRIIDVSSLVLTLAEVPRQGEPIKIERIAIEGGRVNIVMDPETGGVKGLVPLVKPRGGAGTDDASTDVPEQNTRLSNVFVLRNIDIKDLDLSIDDGSGAPPMVVEGFGASLDVAPSPAGDADKPGGPGWYAIDLSTGRSPGLELAAKGWFNIDTLTADVRTGEARVWLDADTLGSLPPRLATLARDHEARGALHATFSGEASVRQPRAARAKLEAKLTEFSIATGDRRLPIDNLDLVASVAQGTGRLERLNVQALGGVLDASGAANLMQEGAPGEINLTFENLDLEKLVRQASPEGEAPELAGIANGRAGGTFNLSDPSGTIKGDGEVHVRNGVLLTIPGLKQLAKVADVATFGQVRERNHKADVLFTLEPGRAVVTQSEITTKTLAARGTGAVGFDQTLDLKVNAGPLEKLQSMLGKVGDLIGKVTDQLATYRVRGTFANPEVTVQPLGVGG